MNTETKKPQNDFGTGPVWRCVMSMALPLTVAQAVHVLYNVVDRVYLGHLAGSGSLALTGVGLCFPIVAIIAAFAALFGNGGTPLCSIARGKGDLARAEQILGNSFVLLCISAAGLMLVGYTLMRPILYAFGASDITWPFARDYLMIYLLGTPFALASTGLNGYINSQGFGRIGMYTVTLGAAVNIALDPLFIFVFNMGVNGAALATVISQGISAVWVLRFLTGKKALFRLKPAVMRLDGGTVKDISFLGLPGFIMQLTNSLTQIVCNATLSTWGGDVYVGIMTVLNSVREVFTIPVTGLTQGCQPVMGYNYGAGKYDRVRQCITFVSIAGFVCSGIMWIFTLATPGFFFRLFSKDDSLLTLGVPALRLFFMGFFMMSLQFAGQNVFTGLGRAKQAVFFSLLRKAFIVVPLTLILPYVAGLGVNGVFLAEPISNVIGGLACYLTMLRTILPELKQKQ